MVSQQICKSEPKRLEERSLLNLLILFRVVIYFCDLISWIRSYDIFRSWITKLSDFAVKIVPVFLATSHDCFELNQEANYKSHPPLGSHFTLCLGDHILLQRVSCHSNGIVTLL